MTLSRIKARHAVKAKGRNVIMPTVYRLPFGATVRIEYVVDLGDCRGRWDGFDAKGVGRIKVEKGPPVEMLDTLYHEMTHCLVDWHNFFVWPMQKSIILQLVQEAAALAAEEA